MTDPPNTHHWGYHVADLLLTASNIALSGLVFMSLWQWFAVPLGAPTIGILHALGLVLLAQFPFTGVILNLDRIDREAMKSARVQALRTGVRTVVILTLWLMGWVYHVAQGW